MEQAFENLEAIRSWVNENKYPVDFGQLRESRKCAFYINNVIFSLQCADDMIIYSTPRMTSLNMGYTPDDGLMSKRFCSVEEVKAEIRNLLDIQAMR